MASTTREEIKIEKHLIKELQDVCSDLLCLHAKVAALYLPLREKYKQLELPFKENK